VWWSFGLFSLASEGYWQILGSVLMTYLIIKVSGVVLLEKTLKSKPKYEEYIKNTSAFFPWFPKK
jgi:steroid 5-alpha reductase family enzyme